MGMYTGLRFSIIVKPKYRQYIKQVNEQCDWLPNESLPIDQYVQLPRYNFIPFGKVCYMPDDWDEEVEKFGNSTYNETTGEWRVICSLKDYDDEIAWFIENILKEITQSYDYIEELYEEWDEVKQHKLQDIPDFPIVEMKN